MNYGSLITDTIGYIERHITEELNPERIAAYAGYSVYHFCRIFHEVQGMPVMDYVRLRRLSLARAELTGSRKIIDIALKYGFETASGFSKAFRKAFGYSPTTYLARVGSWYQGQIDKMIGGLMMHPVIKNMPAFKVAGYGIKTNVESGYTKDIGAYWENYSGENMEEKLYRYLKPKKHGEVGLCVPDLDDGSVRYLFGVVVEDFSKVQPDMMTVEVPDAEYAVFTTLPVDQTRVPPDAYQDDPLSGAVKAAWKYIFEEWFPESGYLYDEGKLDFEFYDERCHCRPDAVMEIYLPVKKAGL